MDRRSFLKTLAAGAAALPFIKTKQAEAETTFENKETEIIEACIPLPPHYLKLYDGNGKPYLLPLESTSGATNKT